MADYIEREAAAEAIKRQFLDTADARDIPLSSALVDVDAIPSADVIELGKEYWLDRFMIKTRDWCSDDGVVRKTSFIIEKVENVGGDIDG